jgi:hypothetical protein
MPTKRTRKEEKEMDRKENSKGEGIRNMGGYKDSEEREEGRKRELKKRNTRSSWKN